MDKKNYKDKRPRGTKYLQDKKNYRTKGLKGQKKLQGKRLTRQMVRVSAGDIIREKHAKIWDVMGDVVKSSEYSGRVKRRIKETLFWDYPVFCSWGTNAPLLLFLNFRFSSNY